MGGPRWRECYVGWSEGGDGTTTVGLSFTEICISPLLNARTLLGTHACTRLNDPHSPARQCQVVQ